MSQPAASAECRCACGSLLARVVARGVELKCRRCKRVVLVSLPAPGPRRPGWTPVRLQEAP